MLWSPRGQAVQASRFHCLEVLERSPCRILNNTGNRSIRDEWVRLWLSRWWGKDRVTLWGQLAQGGTGWLRGLISGGWHSTSLLTSLVRISTCFLLLILPPAGGKASGPGRGTAQPCSGDGNVLDCSLAQLPQPTHTTTFVILTLQTFTWEESSGLSRVCWTEGRGSVLCRMGPGG